MKEQELALRHLIRDMGLEAPLVYIHEGQRGYTCMFHGTHIDKLVGTAFKHIYTQYSCTIASISRQDIPELSKTLN